MDSAYVTGFSQFSPDLRPLDVRSRKDESRQRLIRAFLLFTFMLIAGAFPSAPYTSIVIVTPSQVSVHNP
jgi:hypothetical protein